MKTFFSYGLRSDWRERVERPTALGERFLGTLDALSRIDPVLFANWQLTDLRAMSSSSLDEVRPHIAAFVEKNVALDSFHKPYPDNGYRMVAMTGEFKDPSSTNFRAAAGGKYEGETDLELAEYDVAPDLAIVTYPLFKGALLAINANWQPAWACAYVFRSDYDQVPLFPGAPLFPYSRFHIPWLGYLSAPLAAGLELAPDVRAERTTDGGLLMIAAEERLDPADPEHLRRARILAETMMACTGHGPANPEDLPRAQEIGEAII
jgi:hypothetical protein